MNKSSSQPMYFSYLQLENVKCFGDNQILDLKNTDGTISPWTLILGNNGLGKTTLLKCLAWMATAEETDAEKKKEANIPEDMVAIKPVMDGLDDDAEYEHLARIGTDITAVVSAQLTIGVELDTKPLPEQLVDYSVTFKTQNGKLMEVTPRLTAIKEYSEPVIYAYSGECKLNCVRPFNICSVRGHAPERNIC